jgi:diguanylate cyclase (GGDEF)-like protein
MLKQRWIGRRVGRARDADAAASHRPAGQELRPGSRARLLLLSSCAYVVLAIISSHGWPDDPAIADIWLPSGLNDALALRMGYWAVPVPLLGTLLSNLGRGSFDLSQALVVGLGHSCGTALMAALAPRWMRGRDLFASVGNLFGFLAASGVCALVGTLIASLVLPQLRDWGQEGQALSWWAGNLAGSVVMAPPLLSWVGRNSRTRLHELRRLEFWLLLLACVVMGLVVHLRLIEVFSLRPATGFLPLTLWAGFRFSPAAATPVMAGLALLLARLPNPSDQRLQLANSVQALELLELTVIITLVTALMVLVVNASRTRANRQLQQLAGSLERTVAERTAQLESANALLQRLSDTDGLTGITNRRRFDALLRERWRAATRAGSSLAVAMIDIDHFKAYNDHYGHQAGDRCLQQVATALAAEIRQGSDCLARYGGEEFIVLWDGLDLAQATLMAERLHRRIAALALPHANNPSGPDVSLSIGVAALRLPPLATAPLAEEIESQIAALLRQADERLYAAKSAGRNRVIGA